MTPDDVRSVTIFAPADVHSLEISGVMDAFHEANFEGAAPSYALCVVAEDEDAIRCASGLRIVPDRTIASAREACDTFVVTGSYGVPERPSDRVIEWIREHAMMARRHGAVCTGTFLLGDAGLIEGHRVTTHWDYVKELAARNPTAEIDVDAIFVRDGPLFTSAGVTAAIDLTLALIEEDHGRELALAIARHMVMYLKRPGGQSQFSTPLAAQSTRRTPVARAQQWAAEHPEAELSIAALANRAAMSPRNFARVFREETGITPAEFVARLRIDTARRLLEETQLPLTEVARAAGLGTAASARRAFLRRLGITMREYRERFERTRARN
ncbi:GlxA family transcriptional regulator [Qipengyuania sp. MTN3-11]|uniref:GlxA family transcriptional regulator n=1 Tax=Qipengyuania sp. MTN3-11 TaxID=3056557 RepID=UPI0036F1FF13